MDLQQAIDTLSKFRNVLGSVEALTLALETARNLEEVVKNKTAQRDSLVQDVMTLEDALRQGAKQVEDLKEAAKKEKDSIAEYRRDRMNELEVELKQRREAFAAEIAAERRKAEAALQVLKDSIQALRNDQTVLETSVHQLTEARARLKAAASLV